MERLTVVVDSCVLYPAPLRDLVMHLALAGIYQAKWTDRIHEEWIRNLLLNRKDLGREQLLWTQQKMNEHIGNANVTGYESIIETLTLPRSR